MIRASQVGLKLFHGRADPEVESHDRGEEGPVFLVEYVHVTYQSDMKLGIEHPAGDGDLRCVEDLDFYDGVYYGDWSGFPVELLKVEKELALRVVPCDP